MTEQIKHKESKKTKVGRPKKKQLQDHFIREVRVQYQRSKLAPFKIGEPEHIAQFLRSVAVDNSREQFFALFLDGSHHVASYSLVSIGGAASCPIHPREIFQRAVLVGAIAYVIAHNHPSGAMVPSEPDWVMTKRLHAAGQVLSIPLLDHVIFSDKDHYSMRTDSRWPFSAIEIDAGKLIL